MNQSRREFLKISSLGIGGVALSAPRLIVMYVSGNALAGFTKMKKARYGKSSEMTTIRIVMEGFVLGEQVELVCIMMRTA